MATLVFLKQSGIDDLDLTSDGFTDTLDLQFLNNVGKDLQIVRTTGTGQPLISFEISNDGINWDGWEIEGFIFKDLSHTFEFERTKDMLFRLSWLSNSSTGTFKANFKI